MKTPTRPVPGSRAGVVIAFVAVIAALTLAQRVLIPIALAILFAFVLSPLMSQVQRLVRHRVAAALIVVGLGLGAVAGIGWLVAAQAGELGSQLPRYRQNIMQKVRTLRASLGGSISPVSQTIHEISREITSQPATQPTTAQGNDSAPRSETRHSGRPGELESFWDEIVSRLGSEKTPGAPPADATPQRPLPVTIASEGNGALHMLTMIAAPLIEVTTNLGLTAVLVALLLIQREELRDRVILLAGRKHLSVTTEALDDAARRVSRYLVVLVCLNGLEGLIVAAGLAALGVPGAVLWGLLAALLRFIPFIGIWVAAAMPTILSLAVFDDWTRPLLVAGLFLSSDLIIGSLLEPWLYGVHTGASPLAILMSMVFWTWLWGGVGLFLATPLTVCLVVMARHVPQLNFLGMLLSDRPALSPPERLYHRLLALDAVGAGELVEQEARGRSVAEVYDALMIPALREVEHDRRYKPGGGDRDAFIRLTMTRLIKDIANRSTAPPTDANSWAATEITPAPVEDSPGVLCLPARSWTDELTAQMLQEVLNIEGISARVGSTRMLASELIEALGKDNTSVVCLCAMPFASVPRVKYLCKLLGRSLSELPIVAAIWTSPETGEHPERFIQEGTYIRSATTIPDVVSAIRLASCQAKPRGGESAIPTSPMPIPHPVP